MNIVLNEEEQSALLLCSLEARSVYVFGLRPLMDVRTGLVGVASAISYGGLALCVQYAPPKGSRRPAWLATRPQAINLVDELEREGLAKRYSRKSQEDKQLVVLLAKADRILARPKSEGHMRVTPGEIEQSGVDAGFAGREGHSSKSDEGYISEDRIKPLSVEAVVAYQPAVVARESGSVSVMPVREVQVALLLRNAGVDATPAMLRRDDCADAVRQSDEDWTVAVETARLRKPGGRIHLNYLLPIMAQLRDPPAPKAGLQKGGFSGAQRFNPASALRKVIHGEMVDEQCRTFDAEA